MAQTDGGSYEHLHAPPGICVAFELLTFHLAERAGIDIQQTSGGSNNFFLSVSGVVFSCGAWHLRAARNIPETDGGSYSEYSEYRCIQ